MTSPPRPRLEHLPALDGIRGAAVATVVAFHAHWLAGGYLGVDLFFVLSGFLITRLLLDEHDRSGRIDLRRFWIRRCRRLLPALLTLITVAAIAERWRDRLDGPAGGRRDVVGALTYSSNWTRLSSGAGYWRQFGGPALLDHVWSLAIEEQFYVVWPLVITGLCLLVRRPLVRLLALAVLAIGCAAWSLEAFARWNDANRVYLGTDTRAVALVLGAAVAAFAAWRPLPRGPIMTALTAMAVATITVSMVRLRGDALVTYRGGLLANSVAGAIVVAAASSRPSTAFAPFRSGPLVWLGQRSYGIYLWHWPLMVAFGVADAPLSATWRRLASIGLSLVVAEVSYRFVEQPIRTRGLAVFGSPARLVVPATALLAAAVLAVALPVPHQHADAVEIPLPRATPVGNSAIAATTSEATAPPGSASPPAPPAETAPLVPSTTVATVPRRALPPDRPPRVLYVGDSVGWYLGIQATDDADRMGITAHNAGEPECPLTNVPLRRRHDASSVHLVFAQRCVDAVHHYGALVQEFQPDVVLMVFAGAMFDENEIAPGVWAAPCSTEFEAWYRDQITSSAAALASTGASVYWASAAYYRADATSDLADLDAQIDCLNDSARQAAEGSSGALSILPLGEWTCPTRTCLDQRDGFTLRPDGTHYKDAGAALANIWMLEQVFDRAPWE